MGSVTSERARATAERRPGARRGEADERRYETRHEDIVYVDSSADRDLADMLWTY
jgi:hypothetical protein